MTDAEMKSLFESMAKGQSHDEVEVFRTLRISGSREAVLRTLGRSKVLYGTQDLGPHLKLEGRMSSIRLVTEGGGVQLDPEAAAKAILAVASGDPRLLAALRRELDTVPHPGVHVSVDSVDPFAKGRW